MRATIHRQRHLLLHAKDSQLALLKFNRVYTDFLNTLHLHLWHHRRQLPVHPNTHHQTLHPLPPHNLLHLDDHWPGNPHHALKIASNANARWTNFNPRPRRFRCWTTSRRPFNSLYLAHQLLNLDNDLTNTSQRRAAAPHIEDTHPGLVPVNFLLHHQGLNPPVHLIENHHLLPHLHIPKHIADDLDITPRPDPDHLMLYNHSTSTCPLTSSSTSFCASSSQSPTDSFTWTLPIPSPRPNPTPSRPRWTWPYETPKPLQTTSPYHPSTSTTWQVQLCVISWCSLTTPRPSWPRVRKVRIATTKSNPSWQPYTWRTRIRLFATLQTNGHIITRFPHFIALYLYMIWHLLYPNQDTPTSPLVNPPQWSRTTPPSYKLAGADPLFDILKVIFLHHGLHRLPLLVSDLHPRLLFHLPHLLTTFHQRLWQANLQLLAWRWVFLIRVCNSSHIRFRLRRMKMSSMDIQGVILFILFMLLLIAHFVIFLFPQFSCQTTISLLSLRGVPDSLPS